MKNKMYKLLLIGSAVLGLIAIGVLFFGNGLLASGLFVVSSLICLAIGGRSVKALNQM